MSREHTTRVGSGLDDYEYDLHKMHEDIGPLIQTTFKVMAKTQSVLTA